MILTPRDRRTLKMLVFGDSIADIAKFERVGVNTIKKRIDRINKQLPQKYSGRHKRVLYPVLLLKYGVMTPDQLKGVL